MIMHQPAVNFNNYKLNLTTEDDDSIEINDTNHPPHNINNN